MIVTLERGVKKELTSGLTAAEVLHKAYLYPDGTEGRYDKTAVAVNIGGDILPLSFKIDDDCELLPVTLKDEAGMKVYRHTLSHILAHAVKTIFPTSKCAGGDDTENGFYYDFDFNTPINEDDLVKIENEMLAVIRADLPIERFMLSAEEAVTLMRNFSEPYVTQKIEDCGKEYVSFYKQGDFIDACLNAHLPSTGRIKAFKLTGISGAYWNGKSTNKMLTRISGVAFEKKSELESFLKRLETAKTIQHNVSGRRLGYFTDIPGAGRGLPVILPKGAIAIREIKRFVEDEEFKRGYVPVLTPVMAKAEYLKSSGKISDRFTVGDDRKAKDAYALKSNASPFVFSAFTERQRSYRELPFRISETATVFKNVPCGKALGLTVLRQLTASEEYIIFKNSDAERVVGESLDFIRTVLRELRLDDACVTVSSLGEGRRQRYYGTSKEWNAATALYKKVLTERGINFTDDIESTSPFGPGIDFFVKDVFGKKVFLSFLRYDFGSAKKLKLGFADSDGEKKTPSVIYMSAAGCYERVLAMLIEKNEGVLPVRFAPVQVKVLSVSDKVSDYAETVKNKFLSLGVRAAIDNSSSKLSKKLKNAYGDPVPFVAVVGETEEKSKTVSLKKLYFNGEEELAEELPVETAAELILRS